MALTIIKRIKRTVTQIVGIVSVDKDGDIVTDSRGNPAGNVIVDGLANNAIRVVAGATYNSTLILGFRVLLEGSGTLTFTPNTLGATPVVVTAAEIAEMDMVAHNDWPIACSSITAGTGMELLVYIP